MGEDGGKADWTRGAPKWAAVGALAVFGVAGLAWSMTRDGKAWRRAEPARTVVVMARAQETDASIRAGGIGSRTNVSETKPQAHEQAITPSVVKKININSASQAELELLPGIGPALAQRIIEQRTLRGAFRRVEDLDAVKGIGPKLMERLRTQVCVE